MARSPREPRRDGVHPREGADPVDLKGRVALLPTGGSHRYLMIELACGRPEISQLATLGHELFHAIEIAEEPAVVNPVTLADFYSRIGIETSDSDTAMELELIVDRVREEFRRARDS